MSGKRARRLRRVERSKREAQAAKAAALSPTLRQKLDKARDDRDRELGKLGAEYAAMIEALRVEWAQKRRDIWAAADKRKDMIVQKHREPKTADKAA